MTIKIQWFLNISMVLLSWITIPFLGFSNIKRFLPASLIIVIFELLNARIGKRRRWWFFYHKPSSFTFGEVPFNIGPFFVGTMWILKKTYGNFWRFILLNMCIEAIFVFVITPFSKKLRYYTLVRLTKLQFFVYFFYKAFLLYGLQSLFERKLRRNN